MSMLNALDGDEEMEGKFKMIRIKNKLNKRDSNVLMNYMFMGKVQCEIQVSIQKMDQRDKYLYDYNHFLY
jgi:hypothetical protein